MKENGWKKIERSYLIKIGRFNRTALYVIEKVISEAHSNNCGSYSLTPLVPYMSEVCLGIILTITPTPFLLSKMDVGRLSNDATELKRLIIHRTLALFS